jgi:hypothetical protein
MTYTKKQRNEIYRKALKWFYKYKKEGSYAFLCDCIYDAILKEDDEVTYVDIEVFEELILFRPGKDVFGWWGYGEVFDYNSRETALLFMIAMTE